MKPQLNVALKYSDATEKQRAEVDRILELVSKHKYDSQGIYDMHNLVFGQKEQVQTCSTCLRSRARNLKEWRDKGAKKKSAKKMSEDELEEHVSNLAISNGVTADTPRTEVLEKIKALVAAETNDQVKEALVTIQGKLQEAVDADDAQTAKQQELFDWLEGLVGEVDTVEARAEAIRGVLASQDLTPEQNKYATAALANATPPEPTPEVSEYTGLTEVTLEDDTVINFTANDAAPFEPGVKGTVAWIDESTVKPGKYAVKDGGTLSVQVGGKATFNK